MATMVQRNVALRVRSGAHTMVVPHPGRALFPSGFTSEDAVDYYRAIAPVLLPHLAGRAVSGEVQSAPAEIADQVPNLVGKGVPSGRLPIFSRRGQRLPTELRSPFR